MTDVLEHSNDSSSEELLVDTKATEQLLEKHEKEDNCSKSTLNEACNDGGLLGTQTPQGINNPPTRGKRSVKFNSASSLSTRRKFTIGLVIVAVIATSWVGSTQTAKSSLSGKFVAPFFLMWFGTAWMMAVFPLTAPIYFLTGRGKFNRQGVRELWRYNAEYMQSYVHHTGFLPCKLCDGLGTRLDTYRPSLNRKIVKREQKLAVKNLGGGGGISLTSFPGLTPCSVLAL